MPLIWLEMAKNYAAMIINGSCMSLEGLILLLQCKRLGISRSVHSGKLSHLHEVPYYRPPIQSIKDRIAKWQVIYLHSTNRLALGHGRSSKRCQSGILNVLCVDMLCLQKRFYFRYSCIESLLCYGEATCHLCSWTASKLGVRCGHWSSMRNIFRFMVYSSTSWRSPGCLLPWLKFPTYLCLCFQYNFFNSKKFTTYLRIGQ